jgi:hypothetical protein
MRPRTTDWSLALSVAAGFGTGLWSLVAGRAEQWWIFALHGMAGAWLGLLLLPKLWRVRWRLLPRPGTASPATWRDWRTLAGIGSTLLALLVLGTGVAWSNGAVLVVWGYNLLNWHIVFSFVLVLLVSWHMLVRARPLRKTDLHERRQAVQWLGLLAGGVLLWPMQQWLQRQFQLPGFTRRFTGSREIGSFGGNGAFPYVSWVADRPLPLDVATWQLQISGLVEQPVTLRYDQLALRDTLEATLDCTGGFYTSQQWRGITIARLLDEAKPTPAARWVRFRSATGYHWSLPLTEARTALLATHIGETALHHGHGAPLRLVAPGQRGFVWVKWLVALELHEAPDPAQLLAINSSWTTPIGRGDTQG